MRIRLGVLGLALFYSWDSGRIGVFNELHSLLNERRSQGDHDTACRQRGAVEQALGLSEHSCSRLVIKILMLAGFNPIGQPQSRAH